MTSRQRLRRSAAVPRKLLNLLVRRLAAAVLRRFAGVPKNSIRSMCGGSGAVCAAKPPYPYALRGAFGARRGRMEAGSRRERTLWNVSRAGTTNHLSDDGDRLEMVP
jgi:hypothetical protein